MSINLSQARAATVVEPLCRATESIFRPLNLYPTDHLEITLDEKDGRHFILQVRSLHPRQDPMEPVALVKDGVELVVRGTPSYDAYQGWIGRVPERKDDGFGRWKCAATDFTALVIYHCWPSDKIIFKTPDSKTYFDYLIGRFALQSHAMDVLAGFRIGKTIPDMPADYLPPEDPDLALMPHQKVFTVAGLHQESFAGFLEQGLGKTPGTIARVCLEATRKRAGKIPGLKNTMYRVLVVCPGQVRLNWQREFERFSTVPGKISVLRGGPITRMRTLLETMLEESDCSFACSIISYDSVESTADALTRVPWDLIVLDESHSIKNSRSLRFKAVTKLRDAFSRQRMILTGTPIANNIMDLWAQLEFLGEGMSGFLSFANFRGFYGRFENRMGGGQPIQKLVGIRNLPLLQERLARIACIMTKDEAGMVLPAKTYDIYECQMQTLQADLYRQLCSQLAVELETMSKDGESELNQLTVNHVLTKLLRLAQITSGHIRWDADPDTGTPGKVQQIVPKNPKVEAVVELLQDETRDPLGKTIVWAVFREDIRVLVERLRELKIEHVYYDGSLSDKERQQAVDRFNNDPACRVFIGNPAVAGAGLNLLGYNPERPEECAMYTDHEIFFSQNWSATQRSQAEDRAHRRGTRNSVRITDLVVPGTIDEEIRTRVTNKIHTALAVQDVREILKAVLNVQLESDNA